MDALLTALALVFLAEFGDKSMLLALGFATRYRPWPVFGGIAIASVVMNGLFTLLGAGLGAAVPDRALAIAGGLLFIGFGLWTLRPEDDEDDGDPEVKGGSVLLGVTAAFLIAEFGDKTMFVTITLASTQPALPTWIGASIGMAAASGLAILLGAVLGARLPERVTRIVAAIAFLAFGVLLFAQGVTG